MTMSRGRSNQPVTRELLQSGEMAMDMSDNEMLEHHKSDPKINQDTIIHGIPPGEPIFVFCVFKGKRSNIQAFFDSGCNCWLALDDIPQEEL